MSEESVTGFGGEFLQGSKCPWGLCEPSHDQAIDQDHEGKVEVQLRQSHQITCRNPPKPNKSRIPPTGTDPQKTPNFNNLAPPKSGTDPSPHHSQGPSRSPDYPLPHLRLPAPFPPPSPRQGWETSVPRTRAHGEAFRPAKTRSGIPKCPRPTGPAKMICATPSPGVFGFQGKKGARCSVKSRPSVSIKK